MARLISDLKNVSFVSVDVFDPISVIVHAGQSCRSMLQALSLMKQFILGRL